MQFLLIFIGVLTLTAVAIYFFLQTGLLRAELSRANLRVPRKSRQKQVYMWCVAAFGRTESDSITHRALRMLEEAAEAAQAAGVREHQARYLMSYVWGRPTGNLAQEIGGIEITVLALCSAARIDAEEAAEEEYARIMAKPLEHFRARNAQKNHDLPLH